MVRSRRRQYSKNENCSCKGGVNVLTARAWAPPPYREPSQGATGSSDLFGYSAANTREQSENIRLVPYISEALCESNTCEQAFRYLSSFATPSERSIFFAVKIVLDVSNFAQGCCLPLAPNISILFIKFDKSWKLAVKVAINLHTDNVTPVYFPWQYILV